MVLLPPVTMTHPVNQIWCMTDLSNHIWLTFPSFLPYCLLIWVKHAQSVMAVWTHYCLLVCNSVLRLTHCNAFSCSTRSEAACLLLLTVILKQFSSDAFHQCFWPGELGYTTFTVISLLLYLSLVICFKEGGGGGVLIALVKYCEVCEVFILCNSRSCIPVIQYSLPV